VPVTARFSRLGFEDKEWEEKVIAGLCQGLAKSQYLVYLSFNGPVIVLKLTFDSVMEEILNISRLA
jgi:hypothetical protein